jgi:Tfp pilus assembly protein PilN
MSILDVLKKDIGGKKKAPEVTKSTPSRGAPATAVGPKSGQSRVPIVMPNSPRANLLPPEVTQRARDVTFRRRTWWGLILVILLVVVGIAASYVYAQSRVAEQTAAQQQQSELQTRLNALNSVKKVQGQIAGLEAAQKVAGSTDIDLQAYIQALQAKLPAGTSVSNIAFTGPSVTTPYPAGTGTNGVPVVAKLTFSAATPTLPVLSTWVDALSALPGYVSAEFSSVTQNTDQKGKGTGYTSAITVTIDADAFSHHYLPATKEASK